MELDDDDDDDDDAEQNEMSLVIQKMTQKNGNVNPPHLLLLG